MGKAASEPIPFAGSQLGATRHVCAFFRNADEEYRVLLPFIQDGFESGDRAFHIVDPKLRNEHLRRLASAGIDVAVAERNGQLRLPDWNDTYFRHGHFDQHAMLALIEAELKEGVAQDEHGRRGRAAMRPLGSAWRSLATVLVVVGVLAGCTVGPNYKRPEVIVPADWRNSPERGDSLGDLGWWELFKDPALYELIATAVVANRDLQVAVARVLESRAQLGVARAAQFPQVNAGASYQYTRPFSENSPVLNGSPGRPFTGDDFQTSLDLTFELDLWGRLRRATEAARAELLASEENRRVVLMTLVSDVARTYFDLLELDRELEIARRTLQTREESLQLQRRRLEQGLSTQLDVDRADAEAAVAAATVPDLERRIVQNENGLSVLLGRNPGPIARGTPLDGQRLPPEVPAGLPSALLERRPDIRQAEQTLVAANARIGVAKAEYFPKITLTGVLGVESVALSDLFTGGSRFWSIGPAMTVPLFTAGRTRNTVKGFEARQQQAATRYLQTIQQAFREVEDALVFHRKVWEVRTERERRVAANRRALSLVTLRYERGLSSQFEVLDIQRELFSAELELASATRDQLTAVVQLYRALGGGWQGQPAPSIDGIK